MESFSRGEAQADAQFKMTMGGKEGRKKYMLLLVDTVADPQEIWVSWETIRTGPKEGSKFLVRHYLKSFVFTDAQGKVRYLMAMFRKSTFGWEAATTFHTSRESYFDKKRLGHLTYKK